MEAIQLDLLRALLLFPTAFTLASDYDGTEHSNKIGRELIGGVEFLRCCKWTWSSLTNSGRRTAIMIRGA
jgi:hypothetical protein